MILDKLKELQSNNNWTYESLSEINGQELLDEIQNEYSKIVPIDYVLYSTIPSNVLEITLKSNDQGNKNVLSTNSFYERLLVQILYMESKSLDSLYGQAVIAIMSPGEASFFFEEMLHDEKEYQFLWEEYNRYINRSFNSIMSQTNILNDLTNINKEDLERVVTELKQITNQEDK